MKPFIAVKLRASGHIVYVHRSHFDHEKHVRVSRWPDRWKPGRSKFRIF